MRALSVILACAAVLLALTAASAADRPPIVAVFPLELKGVGLGRDTADRLSEYLEGRMAEGGLYQVVPRDQLKERLVQQKKESYKACYDQSCQIELGKELAAEKSLAPKVMKLGTQCRVTLTLFDLARAATENSATVSGACNEDGIVASLDQAVSRLLQGRPGGGGTKTVDPAAGASPGAGPQAPSPAGPGPTRGKVEKAEVLDTGETIVNAVTDQTGFLTIRTEPAGASLKLNGKDVGVSPLRLEPPVGRYVVVADLGRLYHPARQEVQLTTEGAKVTLTLAPAFGRLEVTSEPAGAEVWVDGEKVGNTPYVNPQKPSGTYEVRVAREHYLPLTRTATVTDGGTERVTARLEANFGAIDVQSSPAGAAVLLDDQATGRKTPASLDSVPPGLHVVKLSLAGHGDAVQQVSVQKGQTARVSLELVAKTGLLAVTSNAADGSPCDGNLVVDGKAVGQTPWKGTVIVGPHEVQVACGAEEGTARVDVAHNQKATVEVRTRGRGVASLPAPAGKAGDLRVGAFSLEDAEAIQNEAVAPKLASLSGRRQGNIEKLKMLLDNPVYRTDPTRAAKVMHMLAESYWEEAMYQYSQKRAAWNQAREAAGPGARVPPEPVEDQRPSLDLYRQILRDYPQYDRIDEVYYHLGRGVVKEGKAKKDRALQKEGVDYMNRLVQNYPKSRYVPEAHLALGEYYFGTNSLIYAKNNFEKITLLYPKSSLSSYAQYKLGWVYFNLQEFDKAIDTFQKAVQALASGEAKGVRQFRNQVLRDLVEVYAQQENGLGNAREYYPTVLPREEADSLIQLVAQRIRSR